MATLWIADISAIATAASNTYKSDYASLVSAGYTGTLADMRRQNYLALNVLTEPQSLSRADLKLRWLRSLGYTGSLSDMQLAAGIPKKDS